MNENREGWPERRKVRCFACLEVHDLGNGYLVYDSRVPVHMARVFVFVCRGCGIRQEVMGAAQLLARRKESGPGWRRRLGLPEVPPEERMPRHPNCRCALPGDPASVEKILEELSVEEILRSAADTVAVDDFLRESGLEI